MLCTATDPATGKVGLAEFAITVVDGPPQIFVSDVVAEADQPAGRELTSYPIVAFDVEDKDLLLECTPSVAEPLPARRGHPGHVRGDR